MGERVRIAVVGGTGRSDRIVSWTAIIPFKGSAERKTRLGSRLGTDERQRLSQELFEHVVSVLRQVPTLRDVALLSDMRPNRWQGPFIRDEGRGMNAELNALVESQRPTRLLVIHADLPLVSVDDIAALITGDGAGSAIAPDRHGSGTNALALVEPWGFDFAFGPNSFARHCAAASGARVVTRLGLGLDIATAADLDAAISAGFTSALTDIRVAVQTPD
jgi:2-phospho-L-lactate/phosphoenolpyruvate guanylyltransferase